MIETCAVGIDFGATNCRAALFSESGELKLRREIPSVGGRPPDEAPERLAELVRALLDEAGGGVRLLGVGIGCPGPIDREREIILEAPNMPLWTRVPLRSMLEDRLSVPVLLENDANLAVLGEYARGSGRNVDSLLGLTLGTGIGGGFVIGGKIVCGAHGMALEVGHLYIGGDGLRCGCGATDCLELYTSGEGIKSWYSRLSGRSGLSCRDVFALARKGEEDAASVVSGAARLFGRALASLQKVLDPERVVLSGGLSREREMFLIPAEEEAKRNLFVTSSQYFDLKEATLGTDAGLHGAAELILSRMRGG